MPLGIRPINDFAFKKTFGSAENRLALISLLNAILKPESPIVDVTLENPFNLQDFQDDRLSILDIKAVDRAGAIYDVEMQLAVSASLVQRIVYYGCELYTDQLREGVEYSGLRPVYSIWLINGILWPDATQVHHAFRLTDARSGRVLCKTLEIHTIELERYNIRESELAGGDMLGCWLFWLKHAHEYEAAALGRVFPQPAIRQATETLRRIAEITEDKTMYDAREKAIRDRKWEIDSAKREGKIEGKIEGKVEGKIEGEREGLIKGKIQMVHMLQRLLYEPLSQEPDLRAMSLDQLDALAGSLQEKLRNRTPS